MVKLTKIGLQVYYVTNSTRERGIIHSCLKYKFEDAKFSKLFREGKWDGYIRFYNKKKGCFDFGFLSLVIQNLEDCDIEWELSGVDVEPFHPNGEVNPALWLHQKEAILKFFEVKHGILKIPTRGGKTLTTSEMMRLIQTVHNDYKFLFIVDTQDLFDQAVNDIAGYFNRRLGTIGKIQGTTFEIKDITVASVQTLQTIKEGLKRVKMYTVDKASKKRFKRPLEAVKAERAERRNRINELESYLKSVNMLVVDECHEHSSESRVTMVKSVPNAEFYLFMSAEPFKSEDELANLRLRSVAGDIFYEVPKRVLQERGVLARDKIVLILMDYKKMVLEGAHYRDYRKEIITNNPLRNAVICNVVELLRKLQLKTLVLFTMKDHGHYIKSITKDPFINGEDALEDRKFISNSFLRGRGKVLLASNIFKKGKTLPQVQVFVNAGGGLEKANIIQKQGRVLGTTETKKKALVVDIIDTGKYFDQHSLSRIEVYEESVGKDNIIVLDGLDIDFYNDLTEIITSWFSDEKT